MPFDIEVRSHKDTSLDDGLAVGMFTVDRSALPEYEDHILAGDITFHLPIKDLDGLNRELNRVVYDLYRSDENLATGTGTKYWKEPVAAATVDPISVLAGLIDIDEYGTLPGDRILVKDHTDASLNGIWIAAVGDWERAEDFDEDDEVLPGTVVSVIQGATYADKLFILSTDTPIEVGTDDFDFEMVSGPVVSAPSYATTSVFGITKISFAAVSPTNPIAVGVNDPTWRSLSRTFYLEAYGHNDAGLAAALSAIGSTPATLVIENSFTNTTTRTTPSTCLVQIRNRAIITVSSSATLTIGKLDNPGNVQVFSVTSTSHIVFAAQAVERFNIAWYVPFNSATDATFGFNDLITSCNNSGGGTIFVPTGKWLLNQIVLPNYVWVLGAGFGGHNTTSSVLEALNSSTTYVLRAADAFRHIHVSDLVISTGNNTNCTAFGVYTAGSDSAFGLMIERVMFYSNGAVASSCPPLLNCTRAGSSETIFNSVRDCFFQVADQSYGFYCDTVNSQFHFDNCSFIVGRQGGSSSGAIHANRCGYLKLTSCDYRGAVVDNTFSWANFMASLTVTLSFGSDQAQVTSGTVTRKMLGQKITGTGMGSHWIKDITTSGASTYLTLTSTATSGGSGISGSVYKSGDITNRAGDAVKISNTSTCVMENCVDEGFNRSLHVYGSDRNRTINAEGCNFQAKVHIDGTAILFFKSNRFFSASFSDTVGSGGLIFSDDAWRNIEGGPNDGFAMTFEGNALTKSTPWGPNHDGGTKFVTEMGYRRGNAYQEFRERVRMMDNSNLGFDLDKAILNVGTTWNYNGPGAVGQDLIRLGVWHPITEEFLYGYTIRRNPLNGFLDFEGNMGVPYSGFSFNGGIGYAESSRKLATQSGSRTATVFLPSGAAHFIITLNNTGALLPGETKSCIVSCDIVQNGDSVDLQFVTGAARPEKMEVWSSQVGGNVFLLHYRNNHCRLSETGVLKVKGWVKRDSNGVPITY